MRILALNWRDLGDPLGGGAELHEILKGAVAAGHEVDLVVAGYRGAPPQATLDGVRVHRRGHWAVANFVLPGVCRRLLREGRYDLLVEDINKVPFCSPLFAGRVPVLAVVPHLFGATVFREANPLVASYVWAAERLLPLLYRGCDFEVISPSTRDDLAARGLDAARIRTVFCGNDARRLALAAPPPRDEPAAGRLEPAAPLQERGRGAARLRARAPRDPGRPPRGDGPRPGRAPPAPPGRPPGPRRRRGFRRLPPGRRAGRDAAPGGSS